MDIQVINEIANPVRQASHSKGGAAVSANAQLKGLKGNPVAAPTSPSSQPPAEEAPESNPDSVTPEISSAARAASDYSAAVGSGLNRDELGAIQNLASRVRTVVSEFLSQPGLEQAGNVEELVAANPEGVEELTSGLEQAVVDTLQVSSLEGAATETATPVNEAGTEAVPVANHPISLERVTQGARRDNPDQDVASKPAPVDERAAPGTGSSANTPEPVEPSHGDFRVTAASPALQNAQAGGNARVETPVSRPEVTLTNPSEAPVSPAVSANNQETPVVAASPAVQNAQAGGNARVETPVSRPEVTPTNPPEAPVSSAVSPNNQETPVVAASPAVQNARAGDNARVETPVSRPAVGTPSQPEAVPSNNQESFETEAPPTVDHVPVRNRNAGNPANLSETSVSPGPEKAQVPTTNPEPTIAPPEEANNEAASNPPPSQSVSSERSGGVPSNDLFSQEPPAANPGNIRDVSALVNSVVDNEFSSEAKKIFSEPKVIRTVADLADFILERLQEIIATKQLQKQSQSSDPLGIS